MKIKLLIITLISLILLISDSIAKEIDKEVFDLINSKNWQKAEDLTENSKYKVLNKIVLSQKFLDSDYKNNNFEEITKFLRLNPHWPQSNILKKKAEDYLTHSTDQRLILNWFDKNKPQTGIGYKLYALAADKILKDESKRSNIIRNGWIYGDFDESEEKKYYKHYGKYLKLEDHIKKIEEYLWNNNVIGATKSMYLVPNGYKKTFLAEIAAIENNGDKETLFSEIKEEFYTPGLLFQYLTSKKKEAPNDLSIKLFKKAKLLSDSHSKEWCKLQIYYAREFIDQKDFASSYKIVSGHFAEDNENIREAEWLSGWLALRFLNKPNIALKHFQKFLTVVTTPISLARGKYWLARTFEKLGDKKTANKLYKEASIYSYTFYGQLAKVELKENKLRLSTSGKVDISRKQEAPNNDVMKAIKLLFANGKFALGQVYAKDAIKEVSDRSQILDIVNIVKTFSNNYHYPLEISREASLKQVFVKDYSFPAPYKIKKPLIETSLIYSIIRQESGFNEYAVDDLNARGLMQIMEPTAKTIAKSMSIKCEINKLNRDPYYNIMFGSKYLKDLSSEHSGSYILTIASYNAGSHRIKKWIGLFGDPRKMNNIRDIIDWVELIPFHITRNYVQRVLENIQVYRTILNKNNDLKLKQDLIAGL